MSASAIVEFRSSTKIGCRHHHYNVFLGEYSYMGTKADEFDATMRHTLTRNTPVVLASFTAEVDYAMKQCIGEVTADSWKPVKIRGAMSRVASLMSGRAFVGLPLSRDPVWVEATVNYTQDVSRAWMKLIMLPWPLRPIIAPFLTEVRNLLRQKSMNENSLAPLIKEKQAGMDKDKTVAGGDMIEWFMQRYKNNQPTKQQLGRDQLLATFASIYNLSNALSYIIYDLAGYPEHIQEMRQELVDVVGEGGVIDKQTLPRLRKLDSFARESQRMNPPSLGKQLTLHIFHLTNDMESTSPELSQTRKACAPPRATSFPKATPPLFELTLLTRTQSTGQIQPNSTVCASQSFARCLEMSRNISTLRPESTTSTLGTVSGLVQVGSLLLRRYVLSWLTAL